MPRSYCTELDVKPFLPPNIKTQGSNPNPNPRNPAPETLQNIDIDFFIQEACSIIDSALGTQYDVPLKKTNEGGDIGYPRPITLIASILCARLIFEQRLQGADRQINEDLKERIQWAEDELMMIQNGERRLQGQRYNRASRFARNTLYNTPKNPAEGGRSKGKSGG